MNWNIDYDVVRNAAVISVDSQNDLLWHSFVRTMSSYSTSLQQQGNRVFIPLRTFLSLRRNIAQFITNHHDVIAVSFSSAINEKLARINTKSYNAALKASPVEETEVANQLAQSGFVRVLTNNQMRNVCKLANLPAGASFSVPGAGKTTEALAFFFFNAKPEDKLLVVAPKNAFGAWE